MLSMCSAQEVHVHMCLGMGGLAGKNGNAAVCTWQMVPPRNGVCVTVKALLRLLHLVVDLPFNCSVSQYCCGWVC